MSTKIKNNQISCDSTVKSVLSKLVGHTKCTKRLHCSKYASLVSGIELNKWLEGTYSYAPGSCASQNVTQKNLVTTTKPFHYRKKYYICSTLKIIMSKHVKRKHLLDNSDQFCIPIPNLIPSKPSNESTIENDSPPLKQHLSNPEKIGCSLEKEFLLKI